MVYSLPVLIFCFVSIFDSTWADASCNLFTSTMRQGNDENFNNRNVFRSILFEHAVRREPRMVNVCERVGTERLVNNRRIVDSDSRISKFPKRNADEDRRNEATIRQPIRENFDTRRDNTIRIDRGISTNMRMARDFQQKDTREEIRQINSLNRDRQRSNPRESPVRSDRSVPNFRSDFFLSLPDVPRYVSEVSHERSERSSTDLTSRRNTEKVRDAAETSIRMMDRRSRDLNQEQTLRLSREREELNSNHIRSRSLEDVRIRNTERVQDAAESPIRMDGRSRISSERNENNIKSRTLEDARIFDISRVRDTSASPTRMDHRSRDLNQERTLRLSRERNENDVTSRNVEDVRVRNTENVQVSRDLNQERTIRLFREREERNSNRIRSQTITERVQGVTESPIRMDRRSRDLSQDRAVQNSNERNNENDFATRNFEDARIINTERVRDVLETPIRMDRDTRENAQVSREHKERNSNHVRSRSIRSIDSVRDDSETSIRMNCDIGETVRIYRDLTRERTVPLARQREERNSNHIRSRSLKNEQIRNVERVRTDSDSSIRMIRDTRDAGPRVFREREDVTDRLRDVPIRENSRISRDANQRASRSISSLRYRSFEDSPIRDESLIRTKRDSRNIEIRKLQDSREATLISRDLVQRERVERASPEFLMIRDDLIRAVSEELKDSIRIIRDNTRISRELNREIRLSRELHLPAVQVRVIRRNSIRKIRDDSRISRNLNQRDRIVRVTREREGQNAPESLIRVSGDESTRMVRDDTRNLNQRDRMVRITRERENLNTPTFSVRIARDDSSRLIRDDERSSRNLDQRNRVVRVSSNRMIRGDSVRDDVRLSRNLNQKEVRVSRERADRDVSKVSTGMIRDDSIRMIRDDERLSRNVDQRDRVVRVSRERSERDVSRESIDTIRYDSNGMIRGDSVRDDVRLSRKLNKKNREVRVSRERADRDISRVSNSMIRDDVRLSRNLNQRDREVRVSHERGDRDVSKGSTRMIRDDSIRMIRDHETRASTERTTRNSNDVRSRSLEDSRIGITPAFSVRKIQESREILEDLHRNVRNIANKNLMDSRHLRDSHIRDVREEVQRLVRNTRKLEMNPGTINKQTRSSRILNTRYSIKDENNNDVEENSNTPFFQNETGKFSTWSNALSTILCICFVVHVLATSSNTKKSPAQYFSSLLFYQKEKVL